MRTLASMVAGLAIALGSVAAVSSQEAGQAAPLVSIRDLMEKTITPATNTLWNVPEAPTDEEWAALEEAAVTLLVAANVTALGGTGPMDADWVKQPAWQALNRAMIEAGRQARAAIAARNVMALQGAGDALYPPCESCHLQFNPGVIEAQ